MMHRLITCPSCLHRHSSQIAKTAYPGHTKWSWPIVWGYSATFPTQIRLSNQNWLVVVPYPYEKSWSSSVGMMTFPTESKVIKFHGSKPPTRKPILLVSNFGYVRLNPARLGHISNSCLLETAQTTLECGKTFGFVQVPVSTTAWRGWSSKERPWTGPYRWEGTRTCIQSFNYSHTSNLWGPTGAFQVMSMVLKLGPHISINWPWPAKFRAAPAQSTVHRDHARCRSSCRFPSSGRGKPRRFLRPKRRAAASTRSALRSSLPSVKLT